MAWCRRSGAPDMWYEEAGEGSVVVLVHGWSMSSAVWGPLTGHLAMRCRAFAPDMPGHGRTGACPGEGGITSWGQSLVSFFEQLGLCRAFLVGWSMGGMAAIAAFPLLKKYLAGVVLMNSSPCFVARPDFSHALPLHSVRGMEVRLRRAPERALSDFRGLMFADGELCDPLVQEQVAEVLASVARPDAAAALEGLASLAGLDLRPFLPRIDLPTLVVAGEGDPVCPPSASHWMAERLQNARCTLMSGAGHAPHLTMSASMAGVLFDFMERTVQHDV